MVGRFSLKGVVVLLSEMLTYTASEFLDDRTVLVDGDPDSLWPDSYLVRQFNQAQKILARRAWCIIEYGVAPAGVIVLRTGVSLYSVNAAILRVFDSTPSTMNSPLGRTDDIVLRTETPGNVLTAFETGEAAALADAETGAPRAIASDAGSRQVRVYPTPTSTENGVKMALKIARLPLVDLTLDDLEAEPEVPSQWHLDLCEYAAGKALTLPMADQDQKVEGRRLLDAFNETVREARRDRQRFEMGTSRWAFSSSTAVLDR